MPHQSETNNIAVFCDFENVALGVADAKYAKFDILKVEHIIEVFQAIPQLTQLEGPTDPDPTTWPNRPADWPQTRYEKKAVTKAGFFVFQKE